MNTDLTPEQPIKSIGSCGETANVQVIAASNGWTVFTTGEPPTNFSDWDDLVDALREHLTTGEDDYPEG